MTQSNPMLAIDYETADRITLANLIDIRDTLRNEISEYKAGRWMHQEDVRHNKKRIKALNLILEYFGHE